METFSLWLIKCNNAIRTRLKKGKFNAKKDPLNWNYENSELLIEFIISAHNQYTRSTE